jgi:hypothetical protein
MYGTGYSGFISFVVANGTDAGGADGSGALGKSFAGGADGSGALGKSFAGGIGLLLVRAIDLLDSIDLLNFTSYLNHGAFNL